MRVSGPQAGVQAVPGIHLEWRSKWEAAATMRPLLAEYVCASLVQSEIPAGCRRDIRSGDVYPGVTGTSASTTDSCHSANAQGVCSAGVRTLPPILHSRLAVPPLCRTGDRGAEGLRNFEACEHF